MAQRRRSLYIDPVRHAAPIPMGTVVGGILKSSGVMGADPTTGELAATADQQAVFAFENVRRLMIEAGGTMDDIVHLTIFIKDLALREAVNKPWLAFFPDPEDRPARHMVQANLPGEMLVQLEVTAVVGG